MTAIRIRLSPDRRGLAVIRLDLRIVELGARVLDRERMERERVAQKEQIGYRRRGEINPETGCRCRVEPRTVDALDLFGLVVPVYENCNQWSFEIED